MNANKKMSFDEYEMEPSARVWENIKANLPPAAEKKRRIGAWWLMAAAIAGVLLLSNYFFEFDVKLRTPRHTAETTMPAQPKATVPPAVHYETSASLQATTGSSGKNGTGSAKLASGSGKHGFSTGQAFAERRLNAARGRQELSTLQANAYLENTGSVTTVPSTSGRAPAQNGSVRKLVQPTFSLYVPAVQPPDKLHATTGDLDFSHPKKSMSRWEWAAYGSVDYCYRSLKISGTSSQSLPTVSQDALDANESGLQTFSTAVTAGYSFSTHFSLVSGLSVFSAGQEKDRSQVVLATDPSGATTGMYDLNTSAGILTGSGQQFDRAYFDNPDSTLFWNVSTLSPNTTDRSFTLEQQFQFISIPVMIHYRFSERRFTPFAGVGFSAAYRSTEKVTLNGNELNYKYEPAMHDFLFSAEAVAGVKYRLSRHFAAGIQPSFRYGLNSLNGNEQVKWIPYSFGVGFGINYRY